MPQQWALLTCLAQFKQDGSELTTTCQEVHEFLEKEDLKPLSGKLAVCTKTAATGEAAEEKQLERKRNKADI